LNQRRPTAWNRTLHLELGVTKTTTTSSSLSSSASTTTTTLSLTTTIALESVFTTTTYSNYITDNTQNCVWYILQLRFYLFAE